jgi:hypothetical protein
MVNPNQERQQDETAESSSAPTAAAAPATTVVNGVHRGTVEERSSGAPEAEAGVNGSAGHRGPLAATVEEADESSSEEEEEDDDDGP